MIDALELRWKRREKGNQVFCGPEDIEYIESGATVFYTDADFARYDSIEANADAVFRMATKTIAPKLRGIDFDALLNFFRSLRRKYRNQVYDNVDIENASKARADLLKLSEKSFELAALMLNLGQGAIEVLNRNHVRIGEGSLGKPPKRSVIRFDEWRESWRDGAPLPENRSEDMDDEMSIIVSAGLVEDAEPFNLPGAIPYEPDEFGDDEGRYDSEWMSGGPWVARLRALADLAGKKAEHLRQKTGKGGKLPFASRLHGSPEDWLAQACKEFADAHGCKSQAVVLKMVQAVMEAEHGKEAMKKMDGRPSKDRGRKAVRKVAQTKPKTRTV